MSYFSPRASPARTWIFRTFASLEQSWASSWLNFSPTSNSGVSKSALSNLLMASNFLRRLPSSKARLPENRKSPGKVDARGAGPGLLLEWTLVGLSPSELRSRASRLGHSLSMVLLCNWLSLQLDISWSTFLSRLVPSQYMVHRKANCPQIQRLPRVPEERKQILTKTFVPLRLSYRSCQVQRREFHGCFILSQPDTPLSYLINSCLCSAVVENNLANRCAL